MHTIDFVYFDVGGVMMLDFSSNNKWEMLKSDLGVTPTNDQAFERIWEQHESKYCINFDVDKLIPLLQTIAGVEIPDNYSMLDDFVSRFEKNPPMWQVVKRLKKNYYLGLLTNMYPRMLDKIFSTRLIPQRVWDVVVDSSVVGYQKPQTEIFALSQTLAKTRPANILFVDNKQENLDTAKNLGWKTVLFNPQDTKTSITELAKRLDVDLD